MDYWSGNVGCEARTGIGDSMIVFILAALILTGCASTLERSYPDTCVMTQPDKSGPGVTAGTFPCKLRHFEKAP